MTANTRRHRKDRSTKRSTVRRDRDVGELWGKREVSRDSGSTQDIAGMARSLGFSSSEVLEIERIYRAAPKRKSNERRNGDPRRDGSKAK